MPNLFLRRGAAALVAVALLGSPFAARAAAPSHETSAEHNVTADKDTGPSPDEIRRNLIAIKNRLDRGDLTQELLSQEQNQTTALKNAAAQCEQTATDQLARVQQALTAVGTKQADETADLATTRQKIAAYKAQTEGRLAECRLRIVFADSLLARIDAAQKNLLKERLVRHGEGVWELALWNARNPQVWIAAGAEMAGHALDFRSSDAVIIALVLAIVALGVRGGIWWRPRLRRWAAQPPDEIFSAQLFHGLASSFARDVVTWLPVAGITAALIADDAIEAQVSFRSIFAAALFAFLTARILIRGLLAPNSPLRQLIGVNDALARALRHRLSVVAAIAALGVALIAAPEKAELPLEAQLLARAVFVSVFAINLGWLTWLVGRMPRLRQAGGALRLVLVAALLAILVAEWTGYRNFSSYLLAGLLETSAVAGAFWLLGAFVAEVCSGLDGSAHAWSARARERLGLAEEEGFPGLVWMRLIATIVLWGGAGLLLLRAWGLSDTGSALVLDYLGNGFAIGGMKFVPSQLLTGIIVFSVLLGLARWLRNWVETKWLSHRMDRGAKDSIVTITGYCGFIVAALFGLSSAGFSLSNLALIASALSVGIGFGLQNIVSNFVAGLILLFERPIKTGDWVVIGGTEGIVKRIRVRATEIRTFERSDVAVPNSELISAHVKNWTLRDRVGRAVIPIGVAYGSDTELVRDLLLEVANAHRGIVHEVKSDPVKVLFKGFGDCSLNFELSFTVRNVDERSDVVSDINFAIDKAFRTHRVEIPYPQHEVRIRGFDEAVAEMLEARLVPARKKSAAGARPEREVAVD